MHSLGTSPQQGHPVGTGMKTEDARELRHRKVCERADLLGPVQLFATHGLTEPHQAPLSTGFSRQEYWSGLPCLPPGDRPDPGLEAVSPALLLCKS